MTNLMIYLYLYLSRRSENMEAISKFRVPEGRHGAYWGPSNVRAPTYIIYSTRRPGTLDLCTPALNVIQAKFSLDLVDELECHLVWMQGNGPHTSVSVIRLSAVNVLWWPDMSRVVLSPARRSWQEFDGLALTTLRHIHCLRNISVIWLTTGDYFVPWPTNAQLFHKLSHSYMFRHYRVILRELVINTLPIYATISNAAVGNTI